MKRVSLSFAGLKIYFVDREKALEKFIDWAERGTYPVQVVFGPEGCGKSALLRQAMELLKDHGYSVALISPLAGEEKERLSMTEDLKGLVETSLSLLLGESVIKLVNVVVNLLYKVVKRGLSKRIALLLDDVFQAIGVDKASLFVKSLLNIIEYPSVDYEKIVIVVTTSEGITRREIGRHRWAELIPMWNMSKNGFKELYDMIPGDKPPFDEAWRCTGGNPEVLGRLYRANWNVNRVTQHIVKGKRLIPFISSLSNEEIKLLQRTLEDPDYLLKREVNDTLRKLKIQLMNRLVELNLIVDDLYTREQEFWIDTPPPEKDPELGIGEYVAWQTPLHREAVRIALKNVEERL